MKMMTHFKKHENGCRHGQIRLFIGVFLATMGLCWLSKKAGWFPCEMHTTSLLWPIVVLVVGIILLISRRARPGHHEEQK